MRDIITNDECPLFCTDYSLEVEERMLQLRTSGTEEDSLVIECPELDCTLAMEKYIKIRSSGNRTIRSGIFPGKCKLSSETEDIKD